MKRPLLFFITVIIFGVLNAQVDPKNAVSDNNITKSCKKLVFKMNNGMSRLPVVIVKGLTEARVDFNDFSQNDYQLQEFTMTVLYQDNQTFKTSINKGSSFNEQTKYILGLLKPGDVIVVTGITAINSKREITYVEERNFGVY